MLKQLVHVFCMAFSKCLALTTTSGTFKFSKEAFAFKHLIMSFVFFSFFFKFYLFIYYLWLCWVFVSVRGLSLVAASGGHSSSRCAGLSLSWPLLLRSTGSRPQAQQLWLTGLAAPRHVGSSQTRARTHVPCISRQILNHCATREALSFVL